MGNCLFESLNHYLEEKNNYDLRLKIVAYIAENPDLFKEDIINNGFKSVEDYCEIMGRNGRDGDGVALQACVLLYNVRVIVHFDKNKNLVLYPGKDKKDDTSLKECHIKYIPGHYMICKP